MPISSFSIISLIACELNSKKPETVLDLGCGSGFYGAVVRNWVDMGWGAKTELTGVEPFVEYKNPNWQHYKMVNKTIENFLEFDRGKQYDCILFLDVIEHFDRLKGLAILEQLKEKLNPKGWLLVSTPGTFTPQGPEYGNELERHLSFYETKDFTQRGFDILKDGNIKDEFHQYMTVAKYIKRDFLNRQS